MIWNDLYYQDLVIRFKCMQLRWRMNYPGELELLVMLAVARLDDNAYGVTIRQELEQETSRRLALGTVYKILGRLEDKQCLRSRTSPPLPERGGRRKKLYELSPLGLETMHRSLSDLRSMARGLVREAEAR